MTEHIFKWNEQDVGLLSEKQWEKYTEVLEWQEQQSGDFLKFQNQGFFMEKGLLHFISMPLGEDLVKNSKKNELRPLMVVEGGVQRHHKPGMKFICIFLNTFQ